MSFSANESLPLMEKIGENAQRVNHVASTAIAREHISFLDKLSNSGKILARGGLTKAGRALDKHGGRPGSIFPKAKGDPLYNQGQFHLDDIPTHPQTTSYPNRLGGQDIFSIDGRGARFDFENNFTVFLQPKRVN